MLERQAGDDYAPTTITPQMIDAGVERLSELLQAGTGSAYVVSEVFGAMDLARKPVLVGLVPANAGA